jgi:hypothetical protein
MKTALVLSLVLLTGCAARYERIAREQAEQDQATCTSYGLIYGTDEFAQCRLLLKKQRDQLEEQAHEAQMQGFQAMSQYFQNINRPKPVTYCNPNGSGYVCQ